MSSLDPFTYLSVYQKAVLAQGKITTAKDLFLASPVEIARKCKITPAEVTAIVQEVSRAIAPAVVPLSELCNAEPNPVFTTGCTLMDELFGGGIRPSMLWEIVGESAAGKTQLALRLTLTVQLPPDLHGLGGAACYITTKSELQTKRLMEIQNSHAQLSNGHCSFDDIHNVKAPTFDRLLYVVETAIPQLIDQLSRKPARKPVRLIVVDALTELFHDHAKTDSKVLFERSRKISAISTQLHILASKYKVAVLVLNEVKDYVNFSNYNGTQAPSERSYQQQSKWFSRADSIPGENRKEAQLGLSWANQVNARIMLSRTGRRRYLDHPPSRQSPASTPAQAPKSDEPTLVRRCTVIFSSVSQPASVDYIVDESGIVCIDEIVPLAVPFLPPPDLPSIATSENSGTDQLSSSAAKDASLAAGEDIDYDTLFEDDDQFFGTVDIEALTAAGTAEQPGE